jgi:hypothetical protein
MDEAGSPAYVEIVADEMMELRKKRSSLHIWATVTKRIEQIKRIKKAPNDK